MSESGENTILGEALKAELKELVKECFKEEFGANGTGHAEKWFYSSKDAAVLIGIPKSWLESAAKQGKLKRIRFGHYKVFPRDELLRFAQEQKKSE